MIPFNAPPVVGTELDYMQSAMGSGKLCGDGGLPVAASSGWSNVWQRQVLLTPSCTASLEMAALLLDIQPGDEVIMPSYTFVSTANAFVLRGAKIVFVDVRPDTMNINETLIEAAITDKTRVIVRSITRVWPAKWTLLWRWRRSIIYLWWKMPLRA